ncbi:MAG TPA: transglutaminase family protein [Tepidisphaeraceae bacterium]|jgi:transglutaminase-like putative cysteine protease
MYLRFGYEMQFELASPTPMVVNLFTHPSQAWALRRPEQLHVEPDVALETFVDGFGNKVGRIMAPTGKVRLWYDNVALDSGQIEPVIEGGSLSKIEDLPSGCLPFLMASRYCEVERLSPMAWDLFGKTPSNWERVQAVLDWVNKNVTFGYRFARNTKTAWDVWYERKGVCRDFQHLAITLLRALNIPARYATGYLGDIGVPEEPFPMDFSAWMEVYVDRKWITVDARYNSPRIGRVLMARGRDAIDVAITTSFGAAKLEKFHVWLDECAPTAITQADAVPPMEVKPGYYIGTPPVAPTAPAPGPTPSPLPAAA